MFMYRKLLSIFIFILALPQSYAARPPADTPLIINSEFVEYDQKNGIATYRGKVTLKHGPLLLAADSIKVFSADGSLTKAIANGTPAAFTQAQGPNRQAIEAKGNSVTYFVAEKSLLLQESAYLNQQDQVFTGDKIRYDIGMQKVLAQGSKDQRVKLIIPTKQASHYGIPDDQ